MSDGGSAPRERLFRVRGRVQGVGFRWWTRSLARRLALTGSVRNLHDGSVEIRAIGSEAALADLRDALREGPPGARVDAVEEEETHGTPADGFLIVH